MPTVLGAVQIRLYRVRWFFEHLEYNLTLSLLWVTLVRNLVVRIPPQKTIVFVAFQLLPACLQTKSIQYPPL